MHKFLFGNRRTNNSSYSPFGSQKNLKPGIITKIKNKIQGLFEPIINSQSIIQRIQPFEDQNLEQELSNQFKKNLVLIDRIIPNKEDNMVLKRKSILPFDQYLKEELDMKEKLSKETQNDLGRKANDSKIKISNSKKQKKLQKDHLKIYKDRKMEENQKQLDNLNKQNFKQNLDVKKENSSEYLSNCLKKKVKQLDNLTESSILLKQQKGESRDNQQSIKIIENQSIIQNDENKLKTPDQLIKRLKASSSSDHSALNKECIKDDIKMDKQLSSLTDANTKGEGNETLFSFKNGDFQQEAQCNIDNSQKLSIFKLNQEQKFQNNQKSNEYCIKDFHQKQQEFKQETNMIKQKEDCININEQQENKSEYQTFQKSEQSKEIFNQMEGNKEKLQQTKQNVELKKQSNLIQQDSLDLEEFENVNLSNIQIINSKQTQFPQNLKNEQKLENQKEKINSYVFPQGEQLLKKKLQLQKDQLSEKSQKLILNTQNQNGKETQKNILQTSFINNQNKQIIEKNEKLIKEYNPFLVLSPNISSDQISMYFQGSLTSNQIKECIPQNQNPPIINDLFKTSTQQSQQIINKEQDKQNTQNLQSIMNVNNFGNTKILQYSSNKQMEIIQQVPQITPIIQNQSFNFESGKLNYSQFNYNFLFNIQIIIKFSSDCISNRQHNKIIYFNSNNNSNNSIIIQNN